MNTCCSTKPAFDQRNEDMSMVIMMPVALVLRTDYVMDNSMGWGKVQTRGLWRCQYWKQWLSDSTCVTRDSISRRGQQCGYWETR